MTPISRTGTGLAVIDQKGVTLVELLLGVLIGAIVVGAMTSLYILGDKMFRKNKAVSDVKETVKLGGAQLDWLFQRWGTGAPCNDPSGAGQCTPVRDCRVGGAFAYPPPSSMCVTINSGSPCDEVYFYANLHGNGFIERITGAATADAMSCRLSQATGDNCHHLKRGSLFIRDAQDDNKALVFLLGGLSADGLDCISASGNSNATVNRQVTALNGNVRDSNNQLTTSFKMEGGDLLLRVPHRVRLFCQSNPQDNNTLWLYMEATDMASSCGAHELMLPMIAVDSFRIQQQGQGLLVTMQTRGPDNRIMNTQRFFGR